MNRLFWGLLFCLLDFKITVGTAVIGLLPDFVGYFLLMKGLEELAEENRFFDRGRHLAFGLMIASVISYGADLMNPDYMAQVWLWAAELVVLVTGLALVRMLIGGIARMERERKIPLRGELLKNMWMVLMVFHILGHLISWLPVVGDIGAVAAAVVSVLFLAVFHKSRRAFYRAE